jgi:hypothetical protein
MIARPSIEEVHRVIEYDRETGIFKWRAREDVSAYWNRRFAGKRAGYVNAPGEYRRIEWKGWGPFPASHLAWLLVYGDWPTAPEVDHRNLKRDDDRISNLREATESNNAWNKPAYRNSTSGIKGVNYNKKARKWQAQIRVDRRLIYLGFFTEKEDAAAAYAAAARIHHGEFARTE